MCGVAPILNRSYSVFSKNLTWRDMQHLIVLTSSTSVLEGHKYALPNGAGHVCAYIYMFHQTRQCVCPLDLVRLLFLIVKTILTTMADIVAATSVTEVTKRLSSRPRCNTPFL